MTFLPAQVQGRWFYLYLILDLYSRKIVGFEVHDTDSAEHAAHLARRTALAEGVHAMPARPVLHGDNGATLKATTVLAMLHWLGIKPSYSRPRVSDDNAFAEALFRTAKYRPEFPSKGFADLDAARQWAARFVQWYNHEHRHSGIRYVTPAQRHAGQDRPHARGAPRALSSMRAQRNPRRWSGQTRNWTPIAAVTLNPERDTSIQTAAIANPAFRFDRQTCFPVPTWQCPRRGAQRRGWEERSHPEPRAERLGARAWRGWRAPDLPRSEHRGILSISRRSTGHHPTAPRKRQLNKKSLPITGSNLLDTHRRNRNLEPL